MSPYDNPNELLRNARNRPGVVALADVIHQFETGDSEQRRMAIETLLLIGNDKPERIEAAMTDIEPLLNADDTDLRTATAHLIATVTAEHPERVIPLVPAIIDRLDDTVTVRDDLARALAHIARVSPDDVVSAVSSLEDYLDSELPFLRKHAVDAISGVARELPSEVTPLVPALIEVLANRPDTIPGETLTEIDTPQMRRELQRREAQTRVRSEACRQTAALTLAEIGETHPDTLVKHISRFVNILKTETTPDIRAPIIDLCGRIAQEHPTDASLTIEPLGNILLESDHTTVQATTAWTLGILADEYPVAVAAATRPALPTLVDLLGENLYTNGAVTGLLAYVAEQYPEAVKPTVPALLELIDDEHNSVRGGVVWTLGFVGGDDAIDALETVKETDPDSVVRQAASEALQYANDE